MEKTKTISLEEYEDLQRYRKIDQELLIDIAEGIKDILKGKVKEI